jgi:hypothetical protein
MTVSEWLRARTPDAPHRLTERIEAALGSRRDSDSIDVGPHCIDAAESLLRELMSRPSTGREAALDLLAVDALVTYAFEAWSEEPASIPGRAAGVMTRLAATVRA